MVLDVILGDKTHKLSLELEAEGRYRATLDGRVIQVDVASVGPGVLSVLLDGKQLEVEVSAVGDGLAVGWRGHVRSAEIVDPRRRSAKGSGAGGAGASMIRSPMPGKVVRILVQEGEAVRAGAGVLVIEAMKMQNELKASRDGVVKKIFVSEGDAVESKAKLVELGEVVA